MAVKDIISTRGVLTSAGSRVLSDHLPSDDSTIVERLRSAGAVLLGKLNLSEFAIGGTIDHPFGTPRNPWNTDHSAGASSSGSGIAAAAGLCAGALGSDTGGSIRGPSSFYSIAGIRPTYGRVTRHAVVPMAWSLDTVGPMTRTVEDCAIVLQAIAGRDPRDPSSSSERSGAVFISIADVECAAFHSKWLRTRGDDYDWSTRTRLESAALAPATAHIRAERARALIRREMLEALETHDVLVMPTRPVPPPSIDASTGSPATTRAGWTWAGVATPVQRRWLAFPRCRCPAVSRRRGFP